jgi:DNA-binding transcriptional ArsR family regulator
MADFFPDDDLPAQDEVLQVMFWLRGERLAEEVNTADVSRLTGGADAAVRRVLDRLVERGLVAVTRGDVESRYVLTPEGVREGGRRFADEFADLTKPGHGECGDPDCDCRQSGNVEDCRHRA